jgi:hypothetical protein
MAAGRPGDGYGGPAQTHRKVCPAVQK